MPRSRALSTGALRGRSTSRKRRSLDPTEYLERRESQVFRSVAESPKRSRLSLGGSPQSERLRPTYRARRRNCKRGDFYSDFFSLEEKKSGRDASPFKSSNRKINIQFGRRTTPSQEEFSLMQSPNTPASARGGGFEALSKQRFVPTSRSLKFLSSSTPNTPNTGRTKARGQPRHSAPNSPDADDDRKQRLGVNFRPILPPPQLKGSLVSKGSLRVVPSMDLRTEARSAPTTPPVGFRPSRSARLVKKKLSRHHRMPRLSLSTTNSRVTSPLPPRMSTSVRGRGYNSPIPPKLSLTNCRGDSRTLLDGDPNPDIPKLTLSPSLPGGLFSPTTPGTEWSQWREPSFERVVSCPTRLEPEAEMETEYHSSSSTHLKVPWGSPELAPVKLKRSLSVTSIHSESDCAPDTPTVGRRSHSKNFMWSINDLQSAFSKAKIQN